MTLIAVLAASLLLAVGAASAQARVSGRVVPADGQSPAGVWVVVRSAAHQDSVAVDGAGRFVLSWPELLVDDTVDVLVDAASPGLRRYLPSRVRLPASDLAGEHRFVLVPRVWTIPAGRFAGAQVPISLQRAFTPACSQCSAFYIQPSLLGASAPGRRIQMWPETQFPLRVAFDRDPSAHPITARDSAAFWRTAEQIEADFGRDLFRPARYEETLARPDENEPEDVVLVWIDSTLLFSGLGIAVSEGTKIIYGAVRFKQRSAFTDEDGAGLIAHELVHALGFGHTCSWRSAVAETRHCPGLRADGVSAEDVAYAQLLRAVRGLQQAHDARWGIEAALEGERRVSLPFSRFRPAARVEF